MDKVSHLQVWSRVFKWALNCEFDVQATEDGRKKERALYLYPKVVHRHAATCTHSRCLGSIKNAGFEKISAPYVCENHARNVALLALSCAGCSAGRPGRSPGAAKAKATSQRGLWRRGYGAHSCAETPGGTGGKYKKMLRSWGGESPPVACPLRSPCMAAGCAASSDGARRYAFANSRKMRLAGRSQPAFPSDQLRCAFTLRARDSSWGSRRRRRSERQSG